MAARPPPQLPPLRPRAGSPAAAQQSLSCRQAAAGADRAGGGGGGPWPVTGSGRFGGSCPACRRGSLPGPSRRAQGSAATAAVRRHRARCRQLSAAAGPVAPCAAGACERPECAQLARRRAATVYRAASSAPAHGRKIRQGRRSQGGSRPDVHRLPSVHSQCAQQRSTHQVVDRHDRLAARPLPPPRLFPSRVPVAARPGGESCRATRMPAASCRSSMRLGASPPACRLHGVGSSGAASNTLDRTCEGFRRQGRCTPP